MNRIIQPASLKEMEKILSSADVSSQGVENMAPKAFALPVRLTGVETGAANIIKQEMLTVGGDAAIARGVVEGLRKETDVILLGTVDKIRKVIRKLAHYTTFNIPQIRNDLEKLLSSYLSDYNYELNCRAVKFSLCRAELPSTVSGQKETLLRPRLMGILNVTPDSFSDGGDFSTPGKAIDYAIAMYEEGADIVDIGGESTRPGASPVDEESELKRIIPVIKGIRDRREQAIISVDTYKAAVAGKVLEAGASIINDISAMRFDRKMVDVLLDYPDVPVILMHMQGTPDTMQDDPEYDDVVDELLSFMDERINYCLSAGIERSRIIIDPGIGFGKTFAHNMEILRRLSEFHALRVPVMIGGSRKSFIKRIYPAEPKDRINGSLAVTALAFQHKISLVRVHDVKEHHEFLQTLNSVYA